MATRAVAHAPDSNDAEVRNVRAFTRAEFAALYRRNFRYIFTSARHLGIKATEVDDIVQETFVNAHRLYGSYEDRGKEAEWLFSILYRIVRRHRTATSRTSLLTDAEANPDVLPASAAHGPERELENQEAVRTLERILDRLDPEKRAVLVLAEIEEKSLAEIAEILDLNVNTVASRLRLARERVKEDLAREAARDGWRYK